MKNRHFLRRLRQSALDRELVEVRYRFPGDSKDRVVTMQRCQITHFRKGLVGKVQSFGTKTLRTKQIEKAVRFAETYGAGPEKLRSIHSGRVSSDDPNVIDGSLRMSGTSMATPFEAPGV